MSKIFLDIERLLQERMKTLFPGKVTDMIFLERPAKATYGDLSLSLPLKLSSVLKKSPMVLAEIIKKDIEDSVGALGIEKIEIVKPGFVNFFISKDKILRTFKEFLSDYQGFFRLENKAERILIEFVSANPTGPLSVAHGRQAVIGDVIANILDFLGFDINREYYINDVGTQIDRFADTVYQSVKRLRGEDYLIPEDGYKGDYIDDLANQVQKEGLTDYKDIEKFSVNYVLNIIRQDLKDLGVTYNKWSSQNSLYESFKVDKVIERLLENKKAYIKDDALWFDSMSFGDDKDRVLKRSNGNYTYFSADIAYHVDKIDRGFKRLINLWGPDHHGYIKRMQSGMQAYYGREINLEIILIQLVTLKGNIKMSKRAGTLILLRHLIDEVGKDAARFYYLTRKNSSPLEFDVDLAKAKSLDNPLYYIQYAYARINSIIEKSNLDIDLNSINFISDPEELSLIKEIIFFAKTLESFSKTLEPCMIVDYLKNLATTFHSFYEKFRVINDDQNLTLRRLSLIKGVGLILKLGLSLLKIDAPEKM